MNQVLDILIITAITQSSGRRWRPQVPNIVPKNDAWRPHLRRAKNAHLCDVRMHCKACIGCKNQPDPQGVDPLGVIVTYTYLKNCPGIVVCSAHYNKKEVGGWGKGREVYWYDSGYAQRS